MMGNCVLQQNPKHTRLKKTDKQTDKMEEYPIFFLKSRRHINGHQWRNFFENNTLAVYGCI
jgi:hypothetical protein